MQNTSPSSEKFAARAVKIKSSIRFPVTATDLFNIIIEDEPVKSCLWQIAVNVAGGRFEPAEVWAEALYRLHNRNEKAVITFENLPHLLKEFSILANYARMDLTRKAYRMGASSLTDDECPALGNATVAHWQGTVDRESRQANATLLASRLIARLSPKAKVLAQVLVSKNCFKPTGTVDQTRAAKQLDTTQPSVSRHLNLLKAEAKAIAVTLNGFDL